ncbi:hypothetical protein CALCODRAFT_553675 [Calocera cornea HHB12733]|uniref:G-protein coupled receptors family 1 profile domain-containing protein n=1 Tax=Calocera cornea HHB12733 TaxID=1353952 RepID=A0A165ICR9_9BASI|nr:hypothetical protein CALCODRAFT_553675 [Calocera cornea HHB12733]
MSTRFSVNPAAALIGGIFAQAFLQGFSVVIVLGALYILLKLTKAKERNWILVVVACANLVLSTIDISVSLYYVLHIFLDENSSPEAFILYYVTFREWPRVTRMGLALFQAALGDLVLVPPPVNHRVYRTWVVWGKTRRSLAVIAVPALLWLTCVTLCIVAVHKFAVENVDNFFAGAPRRWNVAILSTTLIQNVLCVSLIFYKLWRVTSAEGPGLQSQISRNLWTVGSMILESGCLYFMTVVTFTIVYLTDPSAFIIIEDMVSPMISIAFSFLLVRVGIQRNILGANSASNAAHDAAQYHYGNDHNRAGKGPPAE